MSKKILILYATAGIGHKKAAIAIKDAFKRKGVDVFFEDVLNHTNKFFKFSYNATYLFLVRYLPTIWGFFYYILDIPWIYAICRPFRRLTNYMNSKNLVKYLLQIKPDIVITTHFMPVEVIAHLKKKNIFETKLITIVTDYESHIFWLSKYVDYYIVASDYTKEDLIKRGIPANKVKPYGIPCAKTFSVIRSPREVKQKIGLDPDKNTIFILGGGFGVGPIRRIVLYLDKSKADFQGIVVCGYNKKLFNAVSEIGKSSAHKFMTYGFVNNVDELMAASDILVSKPGGITVTEALNAALPMIVIHPIPGQEMRNYKFLEKNGAVLKIETPKEILNAVEEIFGSGRLKILKENARKIRLTGSAERVADEFGK